MILFFHLVCLFTRYIVNNISKSISRIGVLYNHEASKSLACQTSFFAGNDFAQQAKYDRGNLVFVPPVYVQRYEAVSLILQREPWKGQIRKVVDFGCAELGFFLFLKHIQGLEEILAIDVDEDLLKRFHYKACPLNFDYLSRRSEPLKVSVYAGSISEYDNCLAGTDAVIGIEVVEHLYSDTLQEMPYNIFHRIKPRLAIFTTPNADFNVLFPNFHKFRHDDHKFEWTRKEFSLWAEEIISQFPEYCVTMYGIGEGPEGSDDVGCCSQMAVFEKISDNLDCQRKINLTNANNYKLIVEYNYPIHVDERSKEEKIFDEVQYQLSKFSYEYDYESGECKIEIPLNDLFEHVNDMCSSATEFQDILQNFGFIIKEKNDEFVLVQIEQNSTNVSDEELCGNEETVYHETSEGALQDCESDWDWTPETLKVNNALDVPWNEILYSSQTNSTFVDTQDSVGNVIDYMEVSNASGDTSHFETKENKFSDKEDTIVGVSPKLSQFQSSRDADVKVPTLKKNDVTRSVELPSVLKVKENLNQCKEEKFVGLSKIPRKRQFAEIDRKSTSAMPSKIISQLSSRPTVRPHSSYVRKTPKKISKSCSLDSCLENINREPYEVQAFYLNLISNGGCAPRSANSLAAANRVSSNKFLVNDAGSPIVDSNSYEKAVDSGYPFSFSPHDTDLTPEQVDELVTENEIAQSSTSEDSLSEDEEVHVDLGIRQNPQDLFFEEIIVENGDLANNNRDGEGNNVQGLDERLAIQNHILRGIQIDRNDNVLMLLPDREELFPPWLLNLVELAQ